jgi:hypothetical protein
VGPLAPGAPLDPAASPVAATAPTSVGTITAGADPLIAMTPARAISAMAAPRAAMTGQGGTAGPRGSPVVVTAGSRPTDAGLEDSIARQGVSG